MAEYYHGTVWQALPQATQLNWQRPRLNRGNDLKYSKINEVDATLDTSRFHISLPTKGKEDYVVDGQAYSARPGEYLLFNPLQHVRAEGRFSEAVEGFCLFLTRETLEEVAIGRQLPVKHSLDAPFDFPWQQQEFVVKNYILQENAFGRYLMHLREQLLPLKSSESLIDWDAFYFGLAEQLLSAHQQIGHHLRAIPSTGPTTKRELYKRISQVHGYIMEHFAEPLNLAELSRVALLSKYYVIRLYKEVYGLTPYQHILQLRIAEAKVLLIAEYSSTEIAALLSFTDRRAFSKVFKRMVGVSPAEYKETGSPDC